MNNQDDRDTLIEKCRHAFHDNVGFNCNDKWNAVIDIIEQKIRTATLDEAKDEVEDEMHEDYPSFDSLLRKIDNLRGKW